MTALGDALAGAREEREWTLREVERRTGIQNAHLSQIEKGVIERPSPNILWLLSELYELDYQDLLRMAGHVEGAGAAKKEASPVGAAMRAMGEMSPEEQHEVLDYIHRRKGGQPAGHS